ncbi:MAG: hypothetical protein UU14_C0042G0005 [Candidatus Roizmanbacteria bacterium GW2011_GWB1_40_7]|uniref:Queuosine 5'-phosphate N-glycosylase/hydrolase n=2 Tax=Candidatus Roizmaniibacteriota TaxID=1752723 RepID=A0A0G0T1G5_9BACT|nr:MAG: hypothetical protein UU14_C0042G0005 [Candidatus Roizmanbacteria bacterium GW2011_GWB1_40_7]KKR91215.1 MAG: hypothetical protein UU41_C0043G0012 [Candidatus Roizmanbacteria bacterium GW2011_GWA1_41_13]
MMCVRKEVDSYMIEQVLSERKDPFGILQSTKYVIEHADSVTIHPGRIRQLANQIRRKLSRNDVLTEEQFGRNAVNPQKVFLEDVVNFCFWTIPGKEKWNIEYPDGCVSDGWHALVACFDRALDEEVPVLDTSYLVAVTDKDVASLFRGRHDTEIPLLEKRGEFLREAGNALMNGYDGSVEKLLERADYNAVNIVREILRMFPSFRDMSHYKGEKVSLLKRAQIAAYDISLLPDVTIQDTEHLTIFADYKLPQILRGFGIVKYDPRLADKVNSYTILEANSPEEVEIRASTIWACELIAHEIGKPPVLVDNALWHLSQDMEKELAPYHRVLSTYY